MKSNATQLLQYLAAAINVSAQNATQDTLRQGINNPHPAIRAAAAENPAATEEILQIAMADEDWEVRAAVASNPNAPPDVLQILLEDCDRDVREAAEHNAKCYRFSRASEKNL